MNISIGAKTDVGGRTNNEDCLAVLDRERAPMRAEAVLVIADGMGGRAHGEEASGAAVKIVRETLLDLLDPSGQQPLPPAEDILAAALRRANTSIFEVAQEHPELPGMGTTCIAALISEGTCTLAHVGDSRAYLVRANKIRPLTQDHTYVADQVRAGNMSNEAAKRSRFKNVITRAIGISPTVEPDFVTVLLNDGDTLLFCTDGLSNTLEERVMLDVMSKSDSAQMASNALLDCAKRSGVADNVTIIVVRVTSDVVSNLAKLDEVSPAETSEVLETTENGLLEPLSTIETSSNGNSTPHSTPPASSGFRYVVLSVLSALVGAALTACLLYATGMLVPAHTSNESKPGEKAGASRRSGTAASDLFHTTFETPVQLFYKPLRPNFLLVSDKEVVVAIDSTGKLVRLNDLGQVDNTVTTSTIVPESNPAKLSFATDDSGDLYTSNSAAKTISETSADGAQHRFVAMSLSQPEALAVDGSGNVYYIDAGELYVVRVSAQKGK